MPSYRLIGLLVVVAAIAFTVGYRLGQRMAPPGHLNVVASCDSGSGSCAIMPSAKGSAQTAPPPQIPPPSGLPALVEFGSDECKECQRMKAVLAALRPKLRGHVEVIEVDTDVYRDLADRWRLRIIPTQVIVSPKGEELARHEGFWPSEEIVARLKSLGLLGKP
ncbi:MAG: thioredoxin family protein [Armatimonadetes bacterium]|nr:thioredoxin family protein [Armatimonadota bacterium]